MGEAERNQRLEQDRQALRELMNESSILQAVQEESDGRRWRWTFQGNGHLPATSVNEVAIAGRHEVEVLLPFDYPDRPPEIRCQTPTFHPSISADGETTVADLGLPWEGRWGLDVICERLWDLLRGASFPEDLPARRPAATRHFQGINAERRLVDPRPLRDRPGLKPENIIRYRPLQPTERDARGETPATAAFHGMLRTAVPPKMKQVRPARSTDEIVFLDAANSANECQPDQGIVFLDESTEGTATERGRP